MKDAKCEAGALCTLARIQLLKERPRAAGKAAENALTLCRKASGGSCEASALECVAAALLERGSAAKAQQLAENSLASFMDGGFKRCQAVAQRVLAKVHGARHRMEEA